MTAQEQQAYRAPLTLLQSNLETELSTLGVKKTDSDDWEMRLDDEYSAEADDNLAGDQAEEAEERIATLALLETRYRNVLRALDKIEAGTFGICELCGEPIERERLEANPAARTCILHRDDDSFLPL